MKDLLNVLKETTEAAFSIPVFVILDDNLPPVGARVPYWGIQAGITEPEVYGKGLRDETHQVTHWIFVDLSGEVEALTGTDGVLDLIDRLKDELQNRRLQGYEFVGFEGETAPEVVVLQDVQGGIKSLALRKSLTARWEKCA